VELFPLRGVYSKMVLARVVEYRFYIERLLEKIIEAKWQKGNTDERT
jgi:hypothetical protein